jgi:hypothetical protein
VVHRGWYSVAGAGPGLLSEHCDQGSRPYRLRHRAHLLLVHTAPRLTQATALPLPRLTQATHSHCTACPLLSGYHRVPSLLPDDGAATVCVLMQVHSVRCKERGGVRGAHAGRVMVRLRRSFEDGGARTTHAMRALYSTVPALATPRVHSTPQCPGGSPLHSCTLLTVACGLCVCVLFRYIFKEKEHAGAHPTPDRTRTLSGRRPRGRPPLSAHAPCPCLSARALRLPARLQVPPCNVHVQGDHTLRPPSRVALLTTPHWILGVTHQVSNLERRTACVWSLIAGGAAPLPQDVAPPLVRAPAHFCAGDVELRRLTAL